MKIKLILCVIGTLSLFVSPSMAQDGKQSAIDLDIKHTGVQTDIRLRNNPNIMGRFSIYLLFDGMENVKQPRLTPQSYHKVRT